MSKDIVFVWGFQLDVSGIDDLKEYVYKHSQIQSISQIRCAEAPTLSPWYILVVQKIYNSANLTDYAIFLAKKHILVEVNDVNLDSESMRACWSEEPAMTAEHSNILFDIPLWGDKATVIKCLSSFHCPPKIHTILSI